MLKSFRDEIYVLLSFELSPRNLSYIYFQYNRIRSLIFPKRTVHHIWLTSTLIFVFVLLTQHKSWMYVSCTYKQSCLFGLFFSNILSLNSPVYILETWLIKPHLKYAQKHTLIYEITFTKWYKSFTVSQRHTTTTTTQNVYKNPYSILYIYLLKDNYPFVWLSIIMWNT